jgi:hypothetical protein
MTENLLLSDAERERFAAYLERDAVSSEGIAEQMQKLGGPVIEPLRQQVLAEAAACRIIAKKLRSTESQRVK